MRAPTRIAAFAAALGVVFGAAALAGASLDPLRDSDGRGHADMAAGHSVTDFDVRHERKMQRSPTT
jgi:hypothetical protein